jgi:hypothetical protein
MADREGGVKPFNPLDADTLNSTITSTLISRPRESFDIIGQLQGCGVYALYYSGSFMPYLPLVKANAEHAESIPIYIGKADPPGGQSGKTAEARRSLSVRLKNHSDRIEMAENLELSDFTFRHLVVDEVWITFCEEVLIREYQPLWNGRIRGFGNKTLGKGRAGQQRSMWDALHPGRAEGIDVPEKQIQAVGLVNAYMKEIFPDLVDSQD